MDILETKTRRAAPLHTPSGLPWIDEAEGRVWFLFESSRRSSSAG